MNTINILSIHEIILKDNIKKKEVKKSAKDNSLLMEICSNENVSYEIKTDIIDSMSNEEDVQNNNINFYITRVIPILEKYSECKDKLNKVNFIKKNKDDTNRKNLLQIIKTYIDIVDEYFPQKYNFLWNIENDSKKTKGIPICDNCKKEQKNLILSDNYFICNNCGNLISIANNNMISFNDIERINIGSKYSYDRRTHFRDCIKRFQGKQNVNVPSEVFERLVEQFLKFQLIPENFKSLPKEVSFEKVTREHVQLFLKELGYNKYYDDIVFIYHKLTGHIIPDITHLENKLILDFDILLDEYDKTFKNDRKNFIHNHYVLFQLLRKHNYKCQKSDFNFLKTNDRKFYHDNICQKLFQNLGWNFKAVF